MGQTIYFKWANAEKWILCSEIRGIERSIEILKMLDETQKVIIKQTEYIDLIKEKVEKHGKKKKN